MAKVTMKELREAYDAHTQFIRSAQSAANDKERANELEIVKRTGAALMALLDRPLRATIDAEFVRMCEASIDRSATMIGNFEFRS